jgi:phosphohistidine phosphatase
MGAHLSHEGLLPDMMIVSPARRTQETAELLLENLPVSEKQIVVDKDLYLADRETMLEIIALYATDNQRLLLLAHNPGMDDIVSYLASSRPSLSDSGKLMTTCAVACFRVNSLDELKKPGQAELQCLIRPKEIVNT